MRDYRFGDVHWHSRHFAAVGAFLKAVISRLKLAFVCGLFQLLSFCCHTFLGRSVVFIFPWSYSTGGRICFFFFFFKRKLKRALTTNATWQDCLFYIQSCAINQTAALLKLVSVTGMGKCAITFSKSGSIEKFRNSNSWLCGLCGFDNLSEDLKSLSHH